MMRSVCFVDRLELEFSGNHFSHAVAIGDVDNDGLNELLIGNVDGVLAIFKGDTSSKAWKKCSGLGTVTCLGVGDIFNSGSNAAVVINAESDCHLFNIAGTDYQLPTSPLATPTPTSNSPPTPTTPTSRTMKPQHVQTLSVANSRVMCLAQIANERQWDLFVGHTDRRVAVYHWSGRSNSLELVKQFSVSGQIGSLSVGQSSDGVPQVLISQPGGTYTPLFCRRDTKEEEEGKPKGGVTEAMYIKELSQALCLGDVVGHAQRRNPMSTTEVVGHILKQHGSLTTDNTHSNNVAQSNIVALCTLDGVVRLLENEQKQWELQVDHNLFSIGKLDVTGNGEDEIVVCAWDGTTYIVDHKRNCVRFWFDQNVSTFCCGCYGMSDGRNVPCLVYSTFTNITYLYRDVTLPAVPSSNLLLTLHNQTLPQELQTKLHTMNSTEKQKLFHKCLYAQEDKEEDRNKNVRMETIDDSKR